MLYIFTAGGYIAGDPFTHHLATTVSAKPQALFLQGQFTEKRLKGTSGSKRASNGYVKKEDMQELVGRINDSRAKILLIALGSPNQEKWFATYKDSLKYVRVVQAVGGTLDTIAGTVKRAPQIWQRCSAEWLYRLIAQPSRIKRQKVLPLFAAAVLTAKMRQLLLRRG